MHRQNLLAPIALVCVVMAGGTLPASAETEIRPYVKSPPLQTFIQDLRGVGPAGIPVAVPDGTRKYRGGAVKADHYTIDINEYTDNLHPDLPPTTLWGYNPVNALGVTGIPTQRHLGGIIVAQRGTPIQITFKNNLPNKHILPVDESLMGADGAVNRTSVHLHGGFVPWTSDGSPFAWWDPQGGTGESFLNNKVLRPGQKVPKNEAEYYYPNDQSARFEWYHDHAIGTTRLNAYAGIASGYIIRDKFESNILVNLLGLPKFVEKGGRELPLVFQDKIFQPDIPDTYFPGLKTKGSLWYPYQYDPDRWDLWDTGTPPPDISVIPEMFGDTMLVNGTAYPKATVDPRRYRLRILNACQARFLNLQLYEENGHGEPNLHKPGPDFLVIGTEGGFLGTPVRVPSGVQMKRVFDSTEDELMVNPADPGGSLITAPAERWDVVVNFAGKGGKKYILYNDAPAPYPMGSSLTDFQGTRVLMQFEVKPDSKVIPNDPPFFVFPGLPLIGLPLAGIDPPLAGPNPKAPIWSLNWASLSNAPLPIPTRPGIKVRQLTLNETFDANGRLIQTLGTNEPTGTLLDGGTDFSRAYCAPATETPSAGATEVWQIVNVTADTHPIHFHLSNAQLLSRRPFDVDKYLATPLNKRAHPVYTGPASGPWPIELGWKETIKMHPGDVTTVIMKFDLPSVPFHVPESPRTGGHEYVWHCHILDHEEHDMMRPLVVMP